MTLKYFKGGFIDSIGTWIYHKGKLFLKERKCSLGKESKN